MTILIDESFKLTYDTLKTTLPHALLLYGASGVGLFTIANELIPANTEVLRIIPTQKTKTALFSIGVDRIRALYEEVKTSASQLIIVDDADAMTDTAQNALLKLLEEPNQYTTFILTSHNPEKLLPTIRSRMQPYHVPSVSDDRIAEQVDAAQGLAAAKKQQVKFLAAGLPAELTRLLEDDTYFKVRSSQMQIAKSLLNASSYDIIAKLTKEKLDRMSAMQLVENCVRLLSLSPTETGMKKIMALVRARESITRGGNPRLHLINAML